MKFLRLYRADKKGNITKPEVFYSSGLISKQINSGDPKALEKYGWTSLIKSHIQPSQNEIYLYDTSCFLSFSNEEQLAYKYLKGRSNRMYNPINQILEAEGYLFEIIIEKSDLQEIGNGVYYYEYKCNMQRDLHFTTQFPVPPSNSFTSCKLCNETNSYHGIIIIDCVKYLNKEIESSPSLKNAYENAKNDKEWLIMSLDPFPEGGRTSLIPPANFWNWKLFKFS